MATLPGLTYSAPGVPLYQPFGAPGSQSTLNFADTYLWEGVTHSTNTAGFYLAAPSTSQLGLSSEGVYGTLTLTADTGDLEIYTANAVNIPVPLNVSSISTTLVDTDTISTSKIDLDGQVLTATPTDLLLNGVPVATISSLSSIADWALEPAISSVNMSGFDLLSTGQAFISSVRADEISTGKIVADSGVFQDISTYTLTALSTIHVISTISSSVIQVEEIYVSTIFATDFISTPDIEVSTINGAQFGSSSITVEVLGVSSLVADSISSAGAALREALISTLQFNPSFSPTLDVNLGLGSLFGNLAGAASGALGVVVGGAALGTGIAALTQSRQTNYINSNAYELVNGTTQLQISTLGTPFSTVYRFVSSVSENVPGQEYFVSTVYAPGTAIRSLSDPLNTVSSPNSTIQSFGQWVALSASLPIPSTVSSFAQLYTSSLQLNPSTVLYSQPSDSELVVGSVPDGADLAQVACSAVRLASTVSGSNGVVFFSAPANRLSFIDGNLSSHTLAYTSDSNLACSDLAVSTINMEGTGTITWDNGASIYEVGANQLFLTAGNATNLDLQPAQIVFSEGGLGGQMRFFENTLEVSAISTLTMNVGVSLSSQQTFVSSLNGGIPYTTANPPPTTLSNANISSIFTSSIKSLGGVSSLSLIANSNNSLTLQSTGDVDVIGRDILIQSQGSTVTTFFISGNTGGGIGSWSNGTTGTGFLNASTIKMSTNQLQVREISTMALESLSSINSLPWPLPAASFLSRSTQVVAANTPLPLWMEVPGTSLGGISLSTNAIVVSYPGTYEIQTSIQLDKSGGGISPCDFWFRKNGVDIPDSASQITVQGNTGETLANVIIFETMAAGDKLEVVMASPDNTMAATFFQSTVGAPYTRPAIPSIITNVKLLG